MPLEKPKLAELRIILKAGDAEVAESTDPKLWQKTLAEITGIEPSATTPSPPGSPATRIQENAAGTGEPVQRFAAEVGVSKDVLVGACSPAATPPYIHLDAHCWEALKRNTPVKGRGSVSASRLAATLLVLWFKAAGLGNPTSAQIQGVVDSINLEEKNLMRGIHVCEWLQVRGDGVVLNPSQTSQAVRLARAYCTKTPLNENGSRS